MDFNGEYTIPADRWTVWWALNDSEVLKGCIDGCESLDWTSETELTGKFKAKIGPVSARFASTLTLSEMEVPESYLLTAQGQGGAAGFFKGSARVVLIEDSEGTTTLRYQSEAAVGGKLASVGSRLVKGAVDKTAADFFQRFSERVVGNVPSVEEPDVSSRPPEPVLPTPPEPVIAPAAGSASPTTNGPTRITWRVLAIVAGVAVAITGILMAIMMMPA
ncbi:CoxG family protein [uncultured Rhodospira sp.]|uniref:CoxG family protein n=1 Tax=uncultured Rhodospira sp. TaxID=1936189 RepID=UPI002624D7DA|nr:carbon monoxide dehydrogenase subunit G [uncultured Rhodospira sp.]